MKEGDIIDTKEHLDSHRALVAKYRQKVTPTPHLMTTLHYFTRSTSTSCYNFVVFLQIRESVINRFVLAKHHYLLSDLVIEEEIPSIG